MAKVRKMNDNEMELMINARKHLKDEDFFDGNIFYFISGNCPRMSMKRAAELVDIVKKEIIMGQKASFLKDIYEKESEEIETADGMTIANLVDEYNDINETLSDLNASNDMIADNFSVLRHDVKCFVDSMLRKHDVQHIYDDNDKLRISCDARNEVLTQDEIEVLVENLLMQADLQSRIVNGKNCDSRCYARAIESLLVYCGHKDDVFVVITDDNCCIDVVMRNGYIVFQREMECVYDMIQRYYDMNTVLNDLINRGDLSDNVPGIQAYCVELRDEIRLDLNPSQWEGFLRNDDVESIDECSDTDTRKVLRVELERLSDLLSHPYNTSYVDNTYSLIQNINKNYGLMLTIKISNEVRYAVDQYGKTWAIAY